jgi:hypothetical protein
MDDHSEEKQRRRREDIAGTLQALEDEYLRCYRLIRKTYDYLEKVGLREFNKYATYKWSFDRENGFSYVCIRLGSSLVKKSLIKRRAYLEEEELYRWIENKDLVFEALDEAYRYIDEKLAKLRLKMGEMQEQLEGYEERLEGMDKAYDEVTAHKELR